MIDSGFLKDYSNNIIILWIRKIITSLFYFRGYRILFPKNPMYAPEYRHYISQINQFPDKYFDCIIIDGRERLGCLVHSMPKLADNGMIIFDDSAMDKFQELYTILDGWHYKSFRFGLMHTTFFTRKKSLLNITYIIQKITNALKYFSK